MLLRLLLLAVANAELVLVLVAGGGDQVRVDAAALGIGAQWAAEQQDVRLGPVDRVVLPAPALLDADRPPLVLRQQSALGERLGQVLGQDHVTAVVLYIYCRVV
jgi:hypothetical protein